MDTVTETRHTDHPKQACPKTTCREKCCCETALLPQDDVPRLPRLRVLDPRHRLGPHVSLQASILDTLGQQGLGRCRCVQFFLGSPRTKITRTIHHHEKEKICHFCDARNMSFYVHCPYVANLAKVGHDGQESANLVDSQLGSLGGLPSACVLHIGSVGTIQQVATRINDLENLRRGIHSKAPRQLLLENSAGQGTSLGRTWDELRHLFEAIDTNRVGLCLDSQHLFAAGMCDFSDHESVVRLFDTANDICPGGLQLIHLNDSLKPFGSCVDRHESIGQGYIWGTRDPISGHQNDESLRSLVERCHETALDMVLETPSQGFDLELLRRGYGC